MRLNRLEIDLVVQDVELLKFYWVNLLLFSRVGVVNCLSLYLLVKLILAFFVHSGGVHAVDSHSTFVSKMAGT